MLVYAKKCLAVTHQLLQLRLSPAQVVMFSKAGRNKAKQKNIFKSVVFKLYGLCRNVYTSDEIILKVYSFNVSN